MSCCTDYRSAGLALRAFYHPDSSGYFCSYSDPPGLRCRTVTPPSKRASKRDKKRQNRGVRAEILSFFHTFRSKKRQLFFAIFNEIKDLGSLLPQKKDVLEKKGQETGVFGGFLGPIPAIAVRAKSPIPAQSAPKIPLKYGKKVHRFCGFINFSPHLAHCVETTGSTTRKQLPCPTVLSTEI